MYVRARVWVCGGVGSRFVAAVVMAMIERMLVLWGVAVRLDVQVGGTGGSLAMVMVVCQSGAQRTPTRCSPFLGRASRGRGE